MNLVASPIVSRTIGLFAVTLLSSSCNKAPHLIDYDEQSNRQARSAPLVVVGVIDSDKPIGGPAPSRSDPRYPMQLRQAKVHIENVLRGSIGGTIFIYYFGFAGGFDGPRPLGFWHTPSRRVLWMRRDGGVLRLACDGWDGCTMPVESGAHQRYQVDLAKPLDYALADLLLTRGEGEINDRRFASEIEWGVPDQGLQEHVIEKLEHLALTERTTIKAAACVQLWIYTQDRIENLLRRQAKNSLAVAHCACKVKPDGNVACE